MKAQYGSPRQVQGVACLCLAVLLGTPTPTSSSAVNVRSSGFLSPGTFISQARVASKEESNDQPTMVDYLIQQKKDKPKIWSPKMHMPVSIALIIAFAWIILLGSTPVLIHVLDHRPVTKTGLTISMFMWTALFGGLYVFTNIVLFSSPHFEQTRSLTIIECIYFMSQIITTVGYGDIVPAYPRGQVFVCIYAVCAFLVIAEIMSEMVKVVSTSIGKYQARLAAESDRLLTPRPAKPSPNKFLASLGTFCLIATMFVLFFHYWPGEEKDFLQAVYMAIITMSTIGFGVVTPVTEEGMVFGAFFMIFGVLTLSRMVMDFSTLMMELSVWERFDSVTMKERLAELSEPQGKLMSDVEFLCLTLLENRIVTHIELDGIRDGFAKMGPRNGAVCIHHLCETAGSDIDPASARNTPRTPRTPRMQQVQEPPTIDERSEGEDPTTPELSRPKTSTRRA